MTRAKLRRLFKTHYGEAASLARELKVSRQRVSCWLKGEFVSARIDYAVRQRAAELLEKEQAPGQVTTGEHAEP